MEGLVGSLSGAPEMADAQRRADADAVRATGNGPHLRPRARPMVQAG